MSKEQILYSTHLDTGESEPLSCAICDTGIVLVTVDETGLILSSRCDNTNCEGFKKKTLLDNDSQEE